MDTAFVLTIVILPIVLLAQRAQFYYWAVKSKVGSKGVLPRLALEALVGLIGGFVWAVLIQYHVLPLRFFWILGVWGIITVLWPIGDIVMIAYVSEPIKLNRER